MSEWFPAVDDAVEGTAGLFGDAAGSALGGVFGGLGNWILQLAVIAVVGLLIAGWMA
jgi:hypothetical protein